MTLSELNNRLTQLLRQRIQQSNHVDSGNLLRNVQFNCSDNPLSIKLKTPEYILYLDKGKFWSDFVTSEPVSDLVAEYVKESLDDLMNFK